MSRRLEDGEMVHSLAFDELLKYDAGDPGITIPVLLKLGGIVRDVDAKLDSGSSFCVFERLHGLSLGLEIESGHRQRIGTATGSFIAYGHSLTLSVKGFDFDVIAYFAEDEAINRNVLGRHGFINRVQLGLIDYEGQLFLSRYGETIR